MEGTDLTQPASNSKTSISCPGRTGEPGRDNQLQTWAMSQGLSAATGPKSFLSYRPGQALRTTTHLPADVCWWVRCFSQLGAWKRIQLVLIRTNLINFN